MSSPLKHEAAHSGNFEGHDNRSIFWGPGAQEKNIRVSWVAMGDREYSFPALMSSDETLQGKRLAEKCDANKLAGKPFIGLTNGEFVADANGVIYWGAAAPPKSHHVSWIDDAGVRVFAPVLNVLCSPEEIIECKQLAASLDAMEQS